MASIRQILCAMLFAIVAASTCAQNYPTRPIRIIVPTAAAGPTDLTARAIAQRMTEAWGQQIIIDNRGGAGGIIAHEIAAKAAPDGYTLISRRQRDSSSIRCSTRRRTIRFGTLRRYRSARSIHSCCSRTLKCP